MTARGGSIIEFDGVTKVYGRQAAVRGVSLAVAPGEIYGCLGPNGSGKTTSIRMMLGFVSPTRGRVRVLGHAPGRGGRGWLRAVGYVPGEPGLPEHMTGLAALKFYSGLSGRKAVLRDWICDLLGLGGRDLGRRMGTYSKGMKQKVVIAQAVQHDPDLLVLDEPTAGLDPLVQARLLDGLRELRRRGRTIFFSTHVLPEVQALCDRVGVLREGRLILDTQVASLVSAAPRRLFVRLGGGGSTAANPPTIRGARFEGEEDGWLVYSADAGAAQGILEDLVDIYPVDFRFEPDFDASFLSIYRGGSAGGDEK